MRCIPVHTYNYLLVKQTYGKQASKIWLYIIIIKFPQFTITTNMWFSTFSNVLINYHDLATRSVIMWEFVFFRVWIANCQHPLHVSYLYIPSSPRTPWEHNFSGSKLPDQQHMLSRINSCSDNWILKPYIVPVKKSKFMAHQNWKTCLSLSSMGCKKGESRGTWSLQSKEIGLYGLTAFSCAQSHMLDIFACVFCSTSIVCLLEAITTFQFSKSAGSPHPNSSFLNKKVLSLSTRHDPGWPESITWRWY